MYEFDTVYQHFDVNKTLRTKKGICFDYANLFAAFCRSQDIRCYVLDGYQRGNSYVQHTWNRVYMNDAWWNLDVTTDAVSSQKGESLYGFQARASKELSGSSPPPEASIAFTKSWNSLLSSSRTKNLDSTIASESTL